MGFLGNYCSKACVCDAEERGRTCELGKRHGWSAVCFWGCHRSLAWSPKRWERLLRAFCSFSGFSSGRGTSRLPNLHSLAPKLCRFRPTAVASIAGNESLWSGVPRAKTSRVYLLYYLHYTAPVFSHCCTQTLIYTVFKHSYWKAGLQRPRRAAAPAEVSWSWA